MKRFTFLTTLFMCLTFLITGLNASQVRIKELTRVEGIRENQLIGYGLVVGLAGTGDSSRNRASMQSILNTLANFGVLVSDQDLAGRNVATVVVTASLPPFAESGDRLDVNVSSMGDARSLTGGTLLQTPLMAPNNDIYALAQGSVSVGGFNYDISGNVVQKNHPTVGAVPNGAIVEKSINTKFSFKDHESGVNNIHLILNESDFTSATRIKDVINREFKEEIAVVVSPSKVKVEVIGKYPIEFLSKIENLTIQPDQDARVVINERTGTIVSGGFVQVADITVSHGSIKVIVSSQFTASQPSFVSNTGSNVSSLIVSNSQMDVKEEKAELLSMEGGASIEDLVSALRQINASTRDIISILQAVKAAGALHAEIIIQ